MERPELLGTQIFDLSGRVAVVTGASRGLGRVMALALAAAGADVVVTSRTQSELDALALEIRDLDRRALAVTSDITDEASCEQVIASAVETFGRIDILVNNAGMNVRKPVLEIEPADYRRVLETNLVGYFSCARAAGRRMVAQGSGKVINISSILGKTALPGQVAYSSSKGAIEMLTRVLAIEWAEANVQVNAIAPSYFETELTRPVREDEARNASVMARTPMRRWGQPHEIAGTAIFLASGASDFMTGTTLYLDGGWTAA